MKAKLKNSEMAASQENLIGKIAKLEDERTNIESTTLELKRKHVSIESRKQTLLEIEMRDPNKSAARSVLSFRFTRDTRPR